MGRARVKPRFRGVSHLVAFFFALGAGAYLVAVASGVAATVGSAVYVSSLVLLFGVSALYHRPYWQPAARRFMRRIDHATIYLLIAGTYTPFCLLALESATGNRLLVLVWMGASAGVAKEVLWPDAPRILSAVLYVLLGWTIVPYAPDLAATLPGGDLALIAAGGLLYTAGAVVYARRAPDPLPEVFGYHEIFHALVVAASLCHFIAVSRVALRAPAIPPESAREIEAPGRYP